MPLALTGQGELVKLVAIRGGQRMRKRLADLGLNLGMTVRVIHFSGHGPMIIAVKDSRMVIGRCMAHKIMVEPVTCDALVA